MLVSGVWARDSTRDWDLDESTNEAPDVSPDLRPPRPPAAAGPLGFLPPRDSPFLFFEKPIVHLLLLFRCVLLLWCGTRCFDYRCCCCYETLLLLLLLRERCGDDECCY